MTVHIAHSVDNLNGLFRKVAMFVLGTEQTMSDHICLMPACEQLADYPQDKIHNG